MEENSQLLIIFSFKLGIHSNETPSPVRLVIIGEEIFLAILSGAPPKIKSLVPSKFGWYTGLMLSRPKSWPHHDGAPYHFLNDPQTEILSQ